MFSRVKLLEVIKGCRVGGPFLFGMYAWGCPQV